MPLFETFPYTNFHDLNLDWILRIVKKMDGVMDNLDDTIHNIVQEELDNINLEKIVLDMVTKYGLAINVVAPPNELEPADPNGEHDSTNTIQGCIDYANSIGGGVVFFPSGRYLTGSLTLKNNVSLVGFDQYTTRITLKGGATAPLISGDVQNCYIGGLTLDGNAEVQVEDITVLALTCNNCGFNNLYTTAGFILMTITGSGGLVWGDNLRFGTCVQNAFVSLGSGKFRFTNMYFENLSSVGGVNVININTDSGLFDFTSVANCTTCCDISGDYNIVHANIENATNKVVDNGEHTVITSYRDILKAAYENYSLYVDGDMIVGSETANVEIIGNNTHFEGSDVRFNQTNPITYSKPQVLNEKFNYVNFKDNEGNNYKVLTEGNNISDYVSVDNFGAVGDGVTDDTQAIKNAVADANNKNKKLIFGENKKYSVKANSVVCNVGIDLNGSTIIVNSGSGDSVFNIEPKHSSNLTLSETAFSMNNVLDNRLYNKVFILESPISLGNRSGSVEDIALEVVLVTDDSGQIRNYPLFFTLKEGTYKATNIHEIENKIYVGNGSVVYNTSNTPPLFSVHRSNVIVDNITCYTEIDNTDYAMGVISISRCAYVEVSRVFGHNPSGSGSGYLLHGGDVSDLYVHDCIFGNKSGYSWGSIGISRATNLYFERVESNRIDTHYEGVGNIIVNDCSTNYITIPCIMYGNYIIKNTILLHNPDDTVSIETRGDLFNALSGNLKIENCRIDNEASNIINVNMGGNNPAYEDLNLNDLLLEISDCVAPTSGGLVYIRCVTSENAGRTHLRFKNVQMNGAKQWINADNNVKLCEMLFDKCFGANFQTAGNFKRAFLLNCYCIGNLSLNTTPDWLVIGNYITNVVSVTIPNIVFANNIIEANIANNLTTTHSAFNGNVLKSGSSENISSWNTTTK